MIVTLITISENLQDRGLYLKQLRDFHGICSIQDKTINHLLLKNNVCKVVNYAQCTAYSG